MATTTKVRVQDLKHGQVVFDASHTERRIVNRVHASLSLNGEWSEHLQMVEWTDPDHIPIVVSVDTWVNVEVPEPVVIEPLVSDRNTWSAWPGTEDFQLLRTSDDPLGDHTIDISYTEIGELIRFLSTVHEHWQEQHAEPVVPIPHAEAWARSMQLQTKP